LPEVALVAILDADREGFLRSQTSLVQTFGRAARNAEGRVILYADKITDSMQRAMDVTTARRKKQEAHNAEHGIVPTTIVKPIRDLLTVPDEEIEEDDGGGPRSSARSAAPRRRAPSPRRSSGSPNSGRRCSRPRRTSTSSRGKLRDEVLRLEALALEMS